MAPPGGHTTQCLRPGGQFSGGHGPTVDARPGGSGHLAGHEEKREPDPQPQPTNRPPGGSIPPTRVFPGRGGIDNVYGPAGRIYSPTTAGLDTKRREPGSKLLPSRREPAHRAPRHHSPSTGPSTIQRPTLILTDNHNGYTQTIIRVLR